jgi:hypothetical protein
MESFEGLIAWIIGLLLAPFVAIFYLARVVFTRLADPNGPKGRLAPSFIETLGIGGCIVWVAFIAAIFTS